MIDAKQLIALAALARQNSYAPYSHYTVGAALLTQEGRVYTGCNIENAAYGPSNCAERTAFFKAVSEGERNFAAIAIIGGQEGKKAMSYAYPCGVCRQVMAEFCDADSFQVIVGTGRDDLVVTTLGTLLPESFGPKNLEN